MSFFIRKWLIIWKMDHPDVNLSFVYEVEPEKIIKCGICDCPADEKEIIICWCSHEYCSDCMLSYLECSKDSSKYYPLKCPANHCEADIFNEYKHLLSKIEYKRLKRIRTSFKILKLKNTIRCKKPFCEGYCTLSSKKAFGNCKKCDTLLSMQQDIEKEMIIKELPVIECPGCKNLIYKEFFCMIVKCLCGTKFCLKCGSSSHKHSQYLCIAKNKQNKVSWWIVLMCLYSYFLFPFYPGLLIIVYHNDWDKTRTSLIDKNYKRNLALIFIVSPVLFVIGCFYLPFKASWMCVECLFDYKKSRALKIAQGVVFVPTVGIIMIGMVFFFGLVVGLLPFVGVYLLILVLVS